MSLIPSSWRLTTLGPALLIGASATAQSIPGAVLAKREPHHHLVYEDSTIRVLRVRVPPHDTTLLHEHDPDYFWVALGASTLVNVRPGVPDATVTSADLAVHYSFGKFAHIARNPGDTPFDNITVELLEAQTGVRNLCETAVAEKPLDCPVPALGGRATSMFTGATEHPALATDQLVVSLATIAPGATLRPRAANTTWVIALDSADAGRALVVDGGPRWVGGTFRAIAGKAWTVKNHGAFVVRVITVVKSWSRAAAGG